MTCLVEKHFSNISFSRFPKKGVAQTIVQLSLSSDVLVGELGDEETKMQVLMIPDDI